MAPLPRMLPLLLLAGCAGATQFPSLQQRAIERQAVLAPDTEPRAAAAADPALTAELAPMVAEAERAHAEFVAEQGLAEAAAARAAGAAEASEPWVAAQQALSVLEAKHGAVQAIAIRLDDLLHDPANAGEARSAAVQAAVDRVTALAAEETAAVAALTARLS